MNDIKIDKSWTGFFKSLLYGFMCVYSWLESQGIDAYAVFVLMGLMSLDMLLGVVKARKLKELENPSSKEAKKGITTKVIMLILPVVAGLLWGLIDKSNAVKISNLLLVALALAEGYSVVGNSYSVLTGKVVSEYDAVTFIFKSVSNGIRLMLEKLLKNLQ